LNILIAQSHEVARRGLHAIFGEDPRVLNIYEVTNQEDLQEYMPLYQADLIVIDLLLITDITVLKKKNFVVLTSEPNITTLKDMYNCGAIGYFSFNVSAEILRASLNHTKKSFLIDPTLGSLVMKAIAHTTGPTSSHQAFNDYKRLATPLRRRHNYARVLKYFCTNIMTLLI